MAKFQAIVRRFALFSTTLSTPPSGQTAEGTQTTIWGAPCFSLGNCLTELCNGYQFIAKKNKNNNNNKKSKYFVDNLSLVGLPIRLNLCRK